MVPQALPFAHQSLGKPCRTDQLVDAVNRTAGLYTHLDDPVLRGIIAGLDRLPSVPHLYLEITQLAARSDATLDELAAAVERDPALVAKVLQMANSAWFGRSRRLTSIREAVQYLGTDVLRGLALGGQAFGMMSIAPFEGFSLEGLQRHSLHTARLAARLLEGQKGVDDVFTTAMVHDIGQVALAAGRRKEYAEVRRRAKAEHRPFHEVEYDAFGATHAGIGAYLLGMWGLPFPIVEATAYHHSPAARRRGRAAHPGRGPPGGRAHEHRRTGSRGSHARTAARHRLPRFVRHPPRFAAMEPARARGVAGRAVTRRAIT